MIEAPLRYLKNPKAKAFYKITFTIWCLLMFTSPLMVAPMAWISFSFARNVYPMSDNGVLYLIICLSIGWFVSLFIVLGPIIDWLGAKFIDDEYVCKVCDEIELHEIVHYKPEVLSSRQVQENPTDKL